MMIMMMMMMMDYILYAVLGVKSKKVKIQKRQTF